MPALHPHTHTHTSHTYTNSNSLLLDLSLPRCNRTNEPITEKGPSHEFKEIKIIILPSYCAHVCIFVDVCVSMWVCVCVRACAHSCMVRINENTWVSLSCAAATSTDHEGQWPYQPSYLAILSSKKTWGNEGSDASLWNVSLSCSPAHSDLYLPSLFTSCSTISSSHQLLCIS